MTEDTMPYAQYAELLDRIEALEKRDDNLGQIGALWKETQVVKDWHAEVYEGHIPGVVNIEKFGRAVVGTSFTPLCFGGVYRTPQVAGATTLRVAAGDVNDTAAGTGAREVTISGIDETGAPITVAIATAGASPSTATTETFLRLNRIFVSDSGSYADPNTPTFSHAGDIVIENGAGGTTWGTVDATSLSWSMAQSEIGAISVPAGFHAHITNMHVSVDSARSTDILIMKRDNILDTAVPYQGMRLIGAYIGITDPFDIDPKFSYPDPATQGATPGFGPLTDIIFFGKVDAATAAISVNFELQLDSDA